MINPNLYKLTFSFIDSTLRLTYMIDKQIGIAIAKINCNTELYKYFVYRFPYCTEFVVTSFKVTMDS